MLPVAENGNPFTQRHSYVGSRLAYVQEAKTLTVEDFSFSIALSQYALVRRMFFSFFHLVFWLQFVELSELQGSK